MFDRARRTRELLLCLLFLLFSLTFALWFLWQSGGVLSVPVWKTVDGHRYYQLLERSLLPGLPLLILAVNGCVVGLTLWGMRRRIYLAGFAACLGTLVLFSCTLQAFFSGYGKHLLTLAAGAGSFWAAFRLSRCRPTGTLPGTRLPLSRLLAGVILALCLLGPLLGTSVNGARAWLRLGGLSLQPGQLLLPLLVWYAASRFPCRSLREVRPFFLLCLAAILSLCLTNDLGGAAILVVLMLVACWYLTDRITLSAGLLCSFLAMFLIFLRLRGSAILSRFNCFRVFDAGDGQQYQALYALLHHGLHGSGVGPDAPYLLSTTVTYAQNDLAALLPVAILGLGSLFLLLLAFAGLLLGPALNPAASPYHVVLHSGAAATLFAQALLNLGGSLNVLPFTGVTFPLLSTGGTALLSAGALLGFCLSAIVWGTSGTERSRVPRPNLFPFPCNPPAFLRRYLP